jgi:hypothetical protein
VIPGNSFVCSHVVGQCDCAGQAPNSCCCQCSLTWVLLDNAQGRATTNERQESQRSLRRVLHCTSRLARLWGSVKHQGRHHLWGRLNTLHLYIFQAISIQVKELQANLHVTTVQTHSDRPEAALLTLTAAAVSRGCLEGPRTVHASICRLYHHLEQCTMLGNSWPC